MGGPLDRSVTPLGYRLPGTGARDKLESVSPTMEFSDYDPSVLIVSRHAGAIAWLKEERPDLFGPDKEEGKHYRVYETITLEECEGKVIFGNMPLSHAAVARCIWAIEFNGSPPRGAEYGADEMRLAGAQLRCYTVKKMKECS